MQRLHLFLLLTSTLVFGCSAERVSDVSIESSGVAISGETPQLPASDWPSWRGGRGDGIALDQPLVTTWSETDHVLWTADIPGRGNSSPIVVGQTVYLATALDSEQQQLVVAYDLATGDQQWSTVVRQGGFPPARQMHDKSTHANGTLACDGERILGAFLGEGSITAFALDLEGNSLWTKEVGNFVSKFGYAPSVQIYRSALIVSADHQGGGYLAALDRETGDIGWRIQRPAKSSYSTGRVVEVAGSDQLIISGAGTVASYDPQTGEERWRADGTASATCGTVVANSTHVFASGGFPESQTISIAADGSREVAWSQRVKLYEPSLLLSENLLFGVTDKGIAYCWSADQGTEHWKTRLEGSFSASPVLVNGLIYVTNNNGLTFVFRATETSYQEVARNQLGDEAYASLAVADSKILARVVHQNGTRKEQLYCLGGDTDEAAQ